MNIVSIQVPDSALSVFAHLDDDLGKSILEAAVVKLYELGKVSQAKAAEILGLSRANFIDLLASYRVSAWQYTKEELNEELGLD